MKSIMLRRFSMAATMFAIGVSSASDFVVSEPTVMTAEQSAIYYEKVKVNADLTIDGADRGLTNSSSIVIGEDATSPVSIVVTNGAKWVVSPWQTMTFSGKGGTIIASSTAVPDFTEGTAVETVVGNARPNSFGTVGYNTDVKVGADVVLQDGVLDIVRILPNGAV